MWTLAAVVHQEEMAYVGPVVVLPTVAFQGKIKLNYFFEKEGG